MDGKSNIDGIIQATTEEIIAFVTPYLGKKEYGNLRITYGKELFPAVYPDLGAYWDLSYEFFVCCSDAVMLGYDTKCKRWGRAVLSPTVIYSFRNREVAILDFKTQIKNIPQIREIYIGKRGLHILEGVAAEKQKLEDLYSDSEIELMNKVGYPAGKI